MPCLIRAQPPFGTNLGPKAGPRRPTSLTKSMFFYSTLDGTRNQLRCPYYPSGTSRTLNHLPVALLHRHTASSYARRALDSETAIPDARLQAARARRALRSARRAARSVPRRRAASARWPPDRYDEQQVVLCVAVMRVTTHGAGFSFMLFPMMTRRI